MTTTFRPRFARTRDNGIATYIRCMGTNHKDEGERGRCTTCLAEIVRVVRPDGNKRLYDVNGRYNAADRYVSDYACWSHTHTCDPVIAASVQAEREKLIAAGEAVVMGQHVTVVKGRKIAKGTAGEVFWIGDDVDFHGAPFVKLGIRDAAGDTHFVKGAYVVATSTIPAAENVPDAPKTNVKGDAPTRRSSGSHAGCEHESTKAARAACRRARQG